MRVNLLKLRQTRKVGGQCESSPQHEPRTNFDYAFPASVVMSTFLRTDCQCKEYASPAGRGCGDHTQFTLSSRGSCCPSNYLPFYRMIISTPECMLAPVISCWSHRLAVGRHIKQRRRNAFPTIRRLRTSNERCPRHTTSTKRSHPCILVQLQCQMHT